MGLSSNVLWHQTNKKGLVGILKSKKLYFSYCLENLLASGDFKGIAFPMVSLSDLPLSEFGEGKWAYGNYAIGLSRNWGIQKGFNPVCYCQLGSDYLKNMQLNLELAIKIGDNIMIEKALYPFAYMKLVEGPLPRKRFLKYRYYDEKEIRLVPNKERIDGFAPFLIDGQYDSYKNTHGNSLLGAIGVDFSYSDICYLLVENEKGRKDVQTLLRNLGVDITQMVILTKQEVLGDIVGNNHNEELPKIKIGYSNISDLAKIVGSEYFDKIKM